MYQKAVVLLLAIFVVGCLPDNKEGKSEFVLVEIADRQFKVPRGYFDGRAPSGKDTESVVLEYSLPDFAVLPPHPLEREARRELINKGLKSSMLLEAEKNRPPAHVSANNFINRGFYTKHNRKFYGLEKYEDLDNEGIEPTRWDDLYFEKNKAEVIVSQLSCSPPKKDKNPGCSHRFMDKGLIYKIRWPIRELPNWQKQREAAINFIDALEITQTGVE